MCGSNPIGDVVSAVSNTVNSVVSTVSNTINREASNLQDSASRSDIGKAVDATVLNPINAVAGATTDVFTGKFDSAGRRIAGVGLALNPLVQAGQASSSINDLYMQASPYTGGYSADLSRVGEISTRYQGGGEINARDRGYLTDYGVKSGAIAGAAYGASALYNGGALAAYEYAAANPLSTIGAAGAVASGNFRKAANDLGAPDFLTKILPDGSTVTEPRSPFPSTSDPMRGPSGTLEAGMSPVIFAAMALGLYLYSRQK